MTDFLTFPFEIKAMDDAGNLEGYASTFGNVDLGFDIVERGAFKKTLKESKGRFPILADHNPMQQIGWNLHAEEDDKGLYVKGWLDVEKNEKAAEKVSMAKKGLELKAKVGLSIGYQTVKYEMDKGDGTSPIIRKLKEVKLFEYSMVTFPMNTQAMVTAAKNLEWLQSTDPRAIDRLIKTMRDTGCSLEDLLKAVETANERGYSLSDLAKHLVPSQAANDSENPEEILQFLKAQADSFSQRLRA